MKDIAIYGAGGLGREVACLLNIINEAGPQWRLIGFFDDGLPCGSRNEYGEILGGIDELNGWNGPLNVVMAIGSPKILDIVTKKITNPQIEFPNIIAPDVISYGNIYDKLGHGNIIGFGSVLSCNTRLGDFNIFNGFVTLGHDSVLGNCNVAMPGTRLSGELKVGDCNLFGANSFVHQGVRIGSGIHLGACSALLRRPKDGCTYLGVPALIMKF